MGHLQTEKKTFQTRKKTPPNRKKHHQTEKKLSKQEKNTFRARKGLSSKETSFEQGKVFQASRWYLPLKYRSLQEVGVFRQGKAVVSDGWYGVIGG